MDGQNGPAKKTDKQDKPNSEAFPADVVSQLPPKLQLKTTLYDLADRSLQLRSRLTKEPNNQCAIYGELNRIMNINGYPAAHIKGLAQVSDKNLPRAWNKVAHGQTFSIYDKAADNSQTATDENSLRQRLRRAIVDETSTLPLLSGEGYYQVLQRMHPAADERKLWTEAHRIKALNNHRDILKIGERLPTASEAERERELEKRLKAVNPGQPQTPPPADQPVPPPAKPGQPQTPPPADQPVPAPAKPGQPKSPADDPFPPAAPIAPVLPPSSDKPPTPPSPSAPTGMSMDSAYKALQANYQQVQTAWSRETQTQGFIGQAFDFAKNHLGSSGEGKAWYDPRRAWSGLLDNDLGSQSVQKQLTAQGQLLAALKHSVDTNDAASFQAGYKQLTGVDFNAAKVQIDPLKANSLVSNFDQSQRTGVDTTTDIAAALAAVASLKCKGAGALGTMVKSTGAGMLIGGTTKAGLMQADGKYGNLPRDFAIGSVMGGTVPVGELAGAQASRLAGKKLGLTVTGDLLTARIETQGATIGNRILSAGLKTGTAGAVFAGIESPTRETVTDIQTGKPIEPLHLAELSIKSAAFGFVGGTLLGGVSDRLVDSYHAAFPGKVNFSPQAIDGVSVPVSGAVTLDEAAKILKVKPEDLVTKSTKDPYGAVKDAVRLHEQSGLNIRKVDGATGKPILPEQFHEALSTVQNVDLLTADSGVKLSQKVDVVQATDSFLKQNPQAIGAPLQNVVSEPNYQAVLRLKTEAGPEAAAAFEQNFRQGFEKDLKTSMAVERIKDGSLSEADALARSTAETEASYKQKAADFFKDMTDPAQRQRLNTLVDDIYEKFNPELITKAQLKDILEGVPKKDRPLAVALLQESAGSSSDTVLSAQLKSLRTDIEAKTGSTSPNDVYTLAPNSSGNLLGYLYRKSNSMHMSIHNIDRLAQNVGNGSIPQQIVLFDDLSSTAISPETRALLKKIPKVYVVDLGAFEKSVNIIDYAKGPQAVSDKLEKLLAEARSIKAQNNKLLPTAVARQTLSGAVDDAAVAIGHNVQIIRPSGKPLMNTGAAGMAAPSAAAVAADAPGAAVSANAAGVTDSAGGAVASTTASSKIVSELHAQLNVAKTTKDEIAGFLSHYAGPERELAALMIADGAVHNSFPVMVKKAIDLHTGLQNTLQAKGLSINDLVMVSDKDAGGSSHLVTYLFGQANDLPLSNFVSSHQLDNLLSSGAAKNKVLGYFDDTIYSGSQTAGMLDSNVAALSPFKRVVVGGLGAYDKGVQRIQATHLGKLGKVDVASASEHFPFYSGQNPFYSKLATPQQALVKHIGGSEGFGDIQGSLIWPYMYPDNNITFFGSQFSGSVLHLPGP